jgi:hypothetical protein
MSGPRRVGPGRTTPNGGGRVTAPGTQPHGRSARGGTSLKRRSPVAYWIAVFAAAALVFGTLATLLSVMLT